MFKFFLLVSFLFVSTYTSAQDEKKTKWVDSVFSKLRIEEKIGQCFLVPISTAASKEDVQALLNQTKAGKIGGLLISPSGPVGFAKLTNRLQANSKIPLLVGANMQFDLSQDFDSVMNFFNPSVLTAIANDSLVKSLNQELSREKDVLHIHFPFYSGWDPLESTCRHASLSIL